MSSPAEIAEPSTVTALLSRLAEVDDRGVFYEDTFVSWRDHLAAGARLGAALRARIDPARPPHVGVLLGNTPFFSTVLVAAALTGIVPVGLNPTRRGWPWSAMRPTPTASWCWPTPPPASRSTA